MKKIVGFNLIYPEGCKEVTDGLKIDELKRRLADLMKSLEETQIDKPFSTESLLNSTDANVNENVDLKMEGLLLHLTSEMFIDHEDIDVQLKIAVCICNIMKLYCPTNPFLSFSDSKTRIKTVLEFLLKCLNEMLKLKSKSDRNFLNLYKVFSISCETNLFHCFISAEDGEKIFIEYMRTMFSIAKKFPDWAEDNKPMQILCDALIVLISSNEISIPDKLVTYIVNFLADRCATKEQKQISIDIINRCLNKLEDQIQTILRNYLIKSELEDDMSDSSDNEEVDEIDDDFCSMPEYQIINRKQEQKLEKSKPKQKLEKNKNTIETCVEYSCDHTFQLVYELFKISAAIVIPLLPTVEMKLRSPNNVTDRKRACRLLGKLFITYIPSTNSSHSSLWECFLGRFCDIELEVREICVRVARDVLKRAISGDEISGILTIPTSKEDLVKALQKRSHDQEESIRYQLVVSISQIFEKSNSIIIDEELDSVNEMLFKILVDRTRDKCMIVRKEANASLGKLYRRILTAAEIGSGDNKNADSITGLGNLLQGQRSRLELLLTQILRLYLRVEVEDKIVVERLFNTFLVPYNMDAANRMKALFHCFIISDDASLMSIQELFKTQVMIMNVLRETVHLIKDSNSEKVLSPSVSQKLKEKVKRLGEYLPSKDKMESLTKFFVMIRSDKKLMEIMLKLVNPDSPRDVIVKSISEVKKHLTTTKPGAEPNPASIQKKKAFASTIKCLLERSAPIIMDLVSGQELISLLVSCKEAVESPKHTEEYTISVSRALKLIHVISIIYRNSIPTQGSYEYIASIISQFDLKQLDTHIDTVQNDFLDDKQLTPSSTKSLVSSNSTVSTFKDIPATIEELCLLTLARIIGSRSQFDSSLDMDDDKFSTCTENSKSLGLFSDATEPLMNQTLKVVQYLLKCATIGSTYPQLYCYPPRSPDTNKNKDRKNFPLPSDEGDREQCLWKYNCRIAKLATRCLIGLYVCSQHESRLELSMQSSKILAMLENHLDGLVKNSSQCELFSSTQSIMLSTLSQLGLNLRRRYGTDIHSYVQNTVLMRILTSDNESSSTELTEPRILSSWVSNNMVSIATQVKIQALKMLSKWMVTLKVEEDRNIILSVMVCLRKYIGSYGNPKYSGNITDGDMAQMRLAAGKCWLRLAQVQSFLSIFDVKWLHRLSGLIYDPCSFVREGFLRKLHKGLFRLQLPLDYMAMFAFVPLVQNSEYQTMAKNFFAANVTRRREFLERNPQYQTDAKLLFAVLPEYVLAFIIHMLAHDEHWVDVDEQPSILRVKQCLWFVMEPILKMNENSSFIRKLLEKIKHAQDATDPNNATVNEKLYICCDISLGLLISKQASYDLKEYPVELKLPRTRYLPAPNTFFNPDFANILVGDPPKVRIQFSPTHKSKQMIMNFMPAPLIKGHVSGLENNNNTRIEDSEVHIQKPIVPVKPKKHIAKIVVGLPEIESEGISGQILQPPPSLPPSNPNINNTYSPKKQINVRKVTTKRKNNRNPDSPPVFEMEEFENNHPTSITKRGRICKPNVRVMKDMVSLSRKPNVVSSNNPISEKNEISNTTVLIEGNVSVNLERISSIDAIEKYDFSSDELDKEKSSSDLEMKLKNFHKMSKIVQKTITTPDKIKRKKFTKTTKSTLNKPMKNVRKSAVSNQSKEKIVIENKSPQNNEKLKAEKIPKKKIDIVNSQPETLPKQNKIITGQNKGDLNSVDSPRKSSINSIRLSVELKKSNEKVTKSKIVLRKVKSIINSITSDSSPRRPLRNSLKVTLDPVDDRKETSDSKPVLASPSSSIRKTRSSQDTTQSGCSDSAILSQLTKQILTRKASSIKPMKMKDMPIKNNNNNNRSNSIVLEVERTPPVKSQRKSLRNNVSIVDSSPLPHSPSTPKIIPGRPKKIDTTPKSPIEIISRSKRMASQAATDSLIKKTRII